jgi:hypothetical protein
MAELHDPHGSVDESITNAPVGEGTDPVDEGTVPVDDSEGTPKPDGLGGGEGTIPNTPNGIGLGHTGEASTFEPEEDEHAE